MAKEKKSQDKYFTVKYLNDEYTVRALPASTVDLLGFRLQPKLLGLGIVTGGIAFDKFNQGENIKSYYEVLEKVFSPEDWQWLMNEFLFNPDYPIQVNGVFLGDRNEVEQHFAGDFCRLYTVVLKLGYLNLGEYKDLLNSLTGAAENIVNSLTAIIESHLKGLEQSFKKYEKSLK